MAPHSELGPTPSLRNPFPCTPSPGPYLLEGSLGLQKADDDKEWDADHGGESQEPADGVAPGRVHVDVVVFERGVLAQGEEEGGLEGGRGGHR